MEFASDRRQGVSASGYGRTEGHSEYEGRFSDDGRWLTYFSYETGRPEVYVVPFRGEGSKPQVSTTGGWLARFSRNELFSEKSSRPN